MTVSVAVRGTQSGTVSRTVIPVIELVETYLSAERVPVNSE